MKIPETVKVGGFIYRIIFKDRFKDDGVNNSGSQSSYTQKIWIDTQAHPQQQEETLLHEIIEAINMDNGLKLEHNQITALSNCLYQVLKDNGLLKED